MVIINLNCTRIELNRIYDNHTITEQCLRMKVEGKSNSTTHFDGFLLYKSKFKHQTFHVPNLMLINEVEWAKFEVMIAIVFRTFRRLDWLVFRQVSEYFDVSFCRHNIFLWGNSKKLFSSADFPWNYRIAHRNHFKSVNIVLDQCTVYNTTYTRMKSHNL